MVASAPRVDMGPGLPATAYRKCRTATSHDELSRSLCFVSPWVVLDAAFSSGGCVHFHLRFTRAGAIGFAHMPKRALL